MSHASSVPNRALLRDTWNKTIRNVSLKMLQQQYNISCFSFSWNIQNNFFIEASEKSTANSIWVQYLPFFVMLNKPLNSFSNREPWSGSHIVSEHFELQSTYVPSIEQLNFYKVSKTKAAICWALVEVLWNCKSGFEEGFIVNGHMFKVCGRLERSGADGKAFHIFSTKRKEENCD